MIHPDTIVASDASYSSIWMPDERLATLAR
jgi:hypothetical protein